MVFLITYPVGVVTITIGGPTAALSQNFFPPRDPK